MLTEVTSTKATHFVNIIWHQNYLTKTCLNKTTEIVEALEEFMLQEEKNVRNTLCVYNTIRNTLNSLTSHTMNMAT